MTRSKDTKTTSGTADELLKDLKAMITEAEKLIARSSSEALDEDPIDLRGRCEAATQKVSEVYVDTKKQTVETAKRTHAFIHENPYASIAIAAASGIITGLLVGHCGTSNKEPS